ncbi:hypothetical protein SLS54_002133 [Diplodia seriata]
MACIDGTTLEGGGQLLRISVGLAALTAEPIRITRIRANRRGKTGLKAQHLSAVQWLALASRAISIGAEQQSQTLDFFPRADVLGQIKSSQKANIINIGSAGSIGLVFQAILPFILFSGRSSSKPFAITIHGGTNVSFSPSYDYISQVLLPTLSLIGLPPITADLHRRGWQRGGKGSITFHVTSLPRSQKLPAFRLESRSAITTVAATILAPSYCQDQAERTLHRVLGASFPHLDESAFAVDFEQSPHTKDLYLILVATSATGHKLGRDWLFDEKITAVPAAVDRLIHRVAAELVEEVRHGGAVDEHLRDQLVVFQALADGPSFVDGGREDDERGGGNIVKPSLHARTAEWVVERVLGARFDGVGGCEGVGFRAGERYAERTRVGRGKRRVRRAASLASLKDWRPGNGDVSGSARRRSMSFGGGESNESRGSRLDAVEPPSFTLPLRSRRLRS